MSLFDNTKSIFDAEELAMLISALDDKYACHPGLTQREQRMYDELVSKLHDMRRRLRASHETPRVACGRCLTDHKPTEDCADGHRGFRPL